MDARRKMSNDEIQQFRYFHTVRLQKIIENSLQFCHPIVMAEQIQILGKISKTLQKLVDHCIPESILQLDLDTINMESGSNGISGIIAMYTMEVCNDISEEDKKKTRIDLLHTREKHETKLRRLTDSLKEKIDKKTVGSLYLVVQHFSNDVGELKYLTNTEIKKFGSKYTKSIYD